MTWFLYSAKQNECCLQIVLTPAIVSASAERRLLLQPLRASEGWGTLHVALSTSQMVMLRIHLTVQLGEKKREEISG